MTWTATGQSFSFVDPILLLAIITLALAVAAFWSIWDSRRGMRMSFVVTRLDRLYAPLHDEMVRYGEGLDSIWQARGPPGSEYEPWVEGVVPVMRGFGYLASPELHKLYEEIVKEEVTRQSTEPEDDASEYYARRLAQLKRFAELAETDYQAIRSKLVRLTK